MRRLATALLIMSLFFLLTGCWDAKSIDKRLLPAIMGVDINTDKQTYQVSLRIPDTHTGSFHVVHAESQTISDALDRIRMNEERSIDVLHLNLIIVSDTLAKKGIGELVQYVIRAKEIKSKALLAIARGNVYTLLKSQKSQRKEQGIEMLDIFSPSAGWTPNISLTYLWEAYRDIHASTADMAVPIIKAGTETLFDIEGSGIFHSDKMVGVISTDETFLYNLFRDRFTTGIVEVTPSASLQIVDVSISHETSWIGNTPHISSTLHVKAIVSEAEEKEGLKSNDLKRELEELLEARFRKLFESVRKQQADILMTGVIFRSKLAPDQIDQWENHLYEKLVIDFKADAVIRNTGNLKMGK